jgi:hypothetical protein
MKTNAAPAGAWEVRVRWGNRALSAEVLDPRGRTELSLGDQPEDDIATGHPARLRFAWKEGRLELRFSAGVLGSAALRGDAATTLSALASRGAITEGAEGFTLVLSAGDTAELTVGRLKVDVREAKGRFPRLPIDTKALVVVVLALAALAVILGSVAMPSEGPKLHWIQRK